jgi:hypothetical protein
MILRARKNNSLARLQIAMMKGNSLRSHQNSIKANHDFCIGNKVWAIPEGYIPSESHGPAPQMTSHETACILNASDQDANVAIRIYFSDREPVGPYQVTVPARRTLHLRFNDLKNPAPIPRDTDYASVITSDVPIIVQHTRLDSRQTANALLTTIAFPASSVA